MNIPEQNAKDKHYVYVCVCARVRVHTNENENLFKKNNGENTLIMMRVLSLLF